MSACLGNSREYGIGLDDLQNKKYIVSQLAKGWSILHILVTLQLSRMSPGLAQLLLF